MPRRRDIVVREATDSELDDLHHLLPAIPDGSVAVRARVLLARVAGDTVGLVVLGREPVSAEGVTALEIAELDVRPGLDRRRITRALVAAAAAEAAALGCDHVLLPGAVTPRRRRIALVSALRRRLCLPAERRPA